MLRVAAAAAVGVVASLAACVALLPALRRLARHFGWTRPPRAVSASKRGKVRIGVVGAARIAPPAVVFPARWLADDCVVAAVAAREPAKAAEFAMRHGIPRAVAPYERLMDGDLVDAVYVPSPNGHHLHWAVKALRAGKHVLCEKPITANAAEAETLARVARECGKLVMNGAHCFYHPALLRARDIVRSGELGSITRVEAAFCSRIPLSDIRFNVNGSDASLAGGSLMDNGIYAVHAVMFLLDAPKAHVQSANAKCTFADVDDSMEAILVFDNSAATGRVHSSLRALAPWEFVPVATVTGTRGSLTVYNYVLPHLWHRIDVAVQGKKARVEKCYGNDGASSFQYQLEAFVRNVRDAGGEGGWCTTNAGATVDNPVAAMHCIDEAYVKAGLQPRRGQHM